jgi:penicillin-binding protein 2
LTLDAQLQKVAIEALGGRRGAVVALEPSSGDILAFVSTPTYDPNLFSQGISHEAYGKLRGSVDKPLVNRALYGRYAPGSTIKPLLALAALENGLKSQEKILCSGRFTLPGSSHAYRCWRRKGHGYVNLHDAIAQSCDLFFYRLAQSIGIGKMADYFGRFGFGQRTGIDLLDEPSGLLPTPEWKKKNRQESWYPGETIITGIGQGYLLVTPLQLAYATASLANRGQAIRPQLLRGLEDPGSGVITHPTQRRGLNIKTNNSSSWIRSLQGWNRYFTVQEVPRGPVAGTVLTESPARPALHKSSGFLKTGRIAATNYLKSCAITLCLLLLHRLSNRESP